MKIFSNNQADIADVSGTDETVNYPASNVQDSRLSRIYRGDEAVDFDIDGGGELKNISEAYTNLILDPIDLTTGNWSSTGIVKTASSESIKGYGFTKITSDGVSAFRSVVQGITVTDEAMCHVILRSVDSDGSTIRIYDNTAATDRMNVEIDWLNTTVTFGVAGSQTKYRFLDDNTVELFVITTGVVPANDNDFRVFPTNAAAAESVLCTACQVVDNTTTFFPFIVGAKSADAITETFTLPDRFTFDLIITPNYSYDTTTVHRMFAWYMSGTEEVRLNWNPGTTDRFDLIWDEGNQRTLISQQFDDGTTYTNINQRIRIVGSMDLVSGGINDSRFIVVPLEAGAINEDISWSGTPDIKAQTYTPLYIGNDQSGGSQADSSYEYLRIYEGLLVGAVTDSDDVTELLKDKKLLLDKTYQDNLTATDLLIAGSTINDGDVITLRGNDVDSFNAGTPVDETVTWSKDIITHTFTRASNQYWRISVNSSNVVDMGRIFLGESMTPPDISPTITHKRASSTKKTITPSRQSYGDIRPKYSIITFAWPAITHSQKQELIDFFDEIDISTPFFITFDETQSDLGTVYVTIDGDGITFSLLVNPAYYSAGLSLQEEV